MELIWGPNLILRRSLGQNPQNQIIETKFLMSLSDRPKNTLKSIKKLATLLYMASELKLLAELKTPDLI
jgi:hypothetical protein